MTETFSNKDEMIKKVLFLVEYPRKGVWAVGFATKENKGEMAEKTNKKLIKRFCSNNTKSYKWFFINVSNR